MSRTHNSSNDNSVYSINVNIVNNASTVESQNELPVTEFTEFPQPVITRIPQSHNNPSLAQILHEIPPPPYPTTDSNMQIPSPSHTTISLTSPPEYTTITTQPQPRVMSHPSNHNRLSDVLMTNDAPNDALLDPSQQLKICKICQESDDFDSYSSSSAEEFIADPENYYNKGKLISPCKCKGSLQYVHIGCLNKWRNSNVRLEASYRCEVCRYEYRFYRPRIAKIFSSSFTLHILSLTLLLFIIYLSSYIVKSLINYNNNVPPPPHLPGKDKNEWRDITFLNIRIIEFIIGISLVSCFGLIFFIFMICCNGFSYTRQHFCYCGGCNGCGYGMYGGSDCSGGGDCGGIVILFFLVIIAVIFVLGFSGAIIAAYLFIQKITTICLEKVHDRILEVKKD